MFSGTLGPVDTQPPGEANFAVGDVIRHLRAGYRGVIVDLDAVFSLTEEWYEQVARSRPPRDKPWYHVLVHGADHMTYVAERHLAPDEEGGPILHPALSTFFAGFEAGRYVRHEPRH